MKNITVNTHITRIYFGLILFCFAPFASAKQPSLANYTTQTSHNCIAYECEKSLYNKNVLDITHNKISPTQYKTLIEKHINTIQTTQTIYPGFTSTVLKKVPKNLKDKALHCHKSKAQKLTWADPAQHSMVVKYHHECWQYRSTATHSDSHTHRAVERISDIVYTIKITRQASACSSALYSIHPTRFECVAISKPLPATKTYSVLPLEAVPQLSSIKIKFDDEEFEFVLLDLSDEGDFEDTVVTPTIVALPEESGNNPDGNPDPSSGGETDSEPDPDSGMEHDDSDERHDSHDSEQYDDDHEFDELHHAEHPH